MPGINQIIQWSEYAMVPLSVLALYAWVRMVVRLMGHYRAARDEWRPPGETPEEREALLYSTREELISAIIQLLKISILVLLVIVVFFPGGEVIQGEVRMLFIRIGLDAIMFLMIANSSVRGHYWDHLSDILKAEPHTVDVQ